MNRTSLLVLFLAVCLTVSLAACGETAVKLDGTGSPAPAAGTQEEASPPEAEEMEEAEETPDEAAPEETAESAAAKDPSLTALRQRITASDCLLGTAFLGTLSEGGQEAYEELVRDGGYLDSYPFLQGLDWEAAAVNSGMEIYAVVPRDEETAVTVRTWTMSESDNYQGTAGDVLSESRAGRPLILMGNVSDIMPNLVVMTAGKDGETLSYSPSLSLYDGRLDLGGVSWVYDFTIYNDLSADPAGEEDLSGTWASEGAADGDGNPYTCCLEFTQDGTMEFFYYRRPGKILERYSGTFMDNGDGTMTFDLTATGGYYLEEGVPAYPLNGVYRLEIPDDNLLFVTHVSGDPLLFGQTGARFTFVRSVG